MLVATQNSFALNGGLSGHKGDEHHLTHHHVVGEEEQQHSLGEEHHHHHQQQLLDEHHSLIHGNDDDDSSQGHDGGLGGNVLEGTNVLPPIAEVEALGKQIGTRDLASHMYTSMVWCFPSLPPIPPLLLFFFFQTLLIISIIRLLLPIQFWLLCTPIFHSTLLPQWMKCLCMSMQSNTIEF